jgi:hypothetical protein
VSITKKALEGRDPAPHIEPLTHDDADELDAAVNTQIALRDGELQTISHDHQKVKAALAKRWSKPCTVVFFEQTDRNDPAAGRWVRYRIRSLAALGCDLDTP